MRAQRPVAASAVFVSATIRTGTSLGTRGVDLGLDFLAREGWRVQGIELRERVSEEPGGFITSALLASLEEIDAILDLGRSYTRCGMSDTGVRVHLERPR